MNSIEKLGYVKFDFLGLKTLTILDKAVKYVRENQGKNEKEFDLDRVPLDDPKVYALLREGRGPTPVGEEPGVSPAALAGAGRQPALAVSRQVRKL